MNFKYEDIKKEVENGGRISFKASSKGVKMLMGRSLAIKLFGIDQIVRSNEYIVNTIAGKRRTISSYGYLWLDPGFLSCLLNEEHPFGVTLNLNLRKRLAKTVGIPVMFFSENGVEQTVKMRGTSDIFISYTAKHININNNHYYIKTVLESL